MFLFLPLPLSLSLCLPSSFVTHKRTFSICVQRSACKMCISVAPISGEKRSTTSQRGWNKVRETETSERAGKKWLYTFFPKMETVYDALSAHVECTPNGMISSIGRFSLLLWLSFILSHWHLRGLLVYLVDADVPFGIFRSISIHCTCLCLSASNCTFSSLYSFWFGA